jgi:hypothetical protein
MTSRRVAAAVLVAVGLSLAVPAGAEQRARTRITPDDAPSASGDRTAVPRPAEERQAVPRPEPAEAPAPKSAAPAPAAEPAPSSRGSRSNGPVQVSPTVTTPTNVGGVTIGKSFVVGSGFSVGHTEATTGSSDGEGSRPDHRDGSRRGRRDSYRDDDVVEVIVPVYVPVAVPGETIIQQASPRPGPPSAAREDDDAAVEPAGSRRSYLRFVPWFSVGHGITAGVPVILPPPHTFDEGNVSSSVQSSVRDGLTGAPGREYAKDVGGVAFGTAPDDAAIYVDGVFVGSTGDYAFDREPLLLKFGGYTIELRADGYLSERFPVYVTLGEVIPFSGKMVEAP